MITTIPSVRAAGSPYELGRQHGWARSATLRAFLDDGLARLNRVLPKPATLAQLGPAIAEYRAAITAAVPDLATEVDGLAEGAGISPDEALLLQLRREIMGYQKVPTLGECTTYARVAGEPVLAQTVDLNCDLDDQLGVLELAPAGSRRRALVLSFGGLLGYLGVNSDGLAVGLNLVLGGEWGPGVPPYLAIRHMLDSAGRVAEAIEVLRGLPLASSRSLTLCDPVTAAYVEVLDGELRVVEAAETVHTNHFLHPDFAPHDELNVFARNSSLRRLLAARAALADLSPGADVQTHFSVLSAAPICVPDFGDTRLDRTVAAVVIRPARGEMHVRPGDPSRSATQAFGLDGRAAGVPGGP
jgi:isopenicillin-N N-acyltransferase-like protein